MKILVPVLLISIIILSIGCAGSKSAAPAPVPGGNFSGQFRLVHTSGKTGKRDTLSANISLNLDLTSGFKVTGDTATVHAGSYGGYAVAANYIQFNDVTYSAAAPVTKAHLEGTYQYSYNGSTFQMLSNSALDTLSYQYDLKKVN